MALFVLGLLAVVVTVTNLDPKGKVSTHSGVTRTHCIAAEEVTWDYAPYGVNQITGQPFNSVEQIYTARGPQRIGTQYIKAIYREYTDATFSQLRPIPSQYQHKGLLGPILYAEADDKLQVVFKNNASIPLSILAEGMTFESELYLPAANTSVSSGSHVLPGDTWTYLWHAKSGPSSESDPSSSLWSYYSQADSYDPYAGLVGAIVVTYPGNLVVKVDPVTGNAYRGLGDIDQEIFTLFATFDENLSPYLETNIATFLGNDSGVDITNSSFQESNRKYSINGYVYGNQPVGINVTAGQASRWNLIALNGNRDNHRPYWPGRMGDLTFSEATALFTLDAITLLPGEEKIIDMLPTATGRTVLMCQVAQNVRGGMLMAYTTQSS